MRRKVRILQRRIEVSPNSRYTNALDDGNCQSMAGTKMRTPLLITALAFCCTAVFAESTTKPGITPVQAELMGDVHAHLLKVGATVYARVTADWRGTDCFLRNGAILEGQVISVVPHTKIAKESQIDLSFTRAQCNELKMGKFELLLVAMAAPPQNIDLGILTEALPMTTSASGPSNNGLAALKTMQMSTNLNLQLDPSDSRPPEIPKMQMGDVSGIRGLKLSVGTGPDNSSVLIAKDHDVSLEKHCVLLLVPLEGTFPRETPNAAATHLRSDAASTSVSAAGTGTAASPAPPPVADIDACEPPQCNVALPSGDAAVTANVAASISIKQLGYSPRPQKVMNSFDNDEALVYLSPKELLVTFNPHILSPRHDLGPAGPTMRVIRAALVDTGSRRVTHTVDWELPDNRQYLWPLAEGRVLVHVGSELRVYGAGLKIQNRISLEGPLAFVRITPDGSFLAIGVIHERHTPELHAQLSQSLEGDPEEDVDIRVLNRNFELIASSKSRSGLIAPTLLNEGQTELLAQPNMHYRISMRAWDSHASTIARFNSSCTPQLSSISPDLIFLVSCDENNEEPVFRVLRPDGKLALKSLSNPNEFGHAAKGSDNQQTFVVKTVQSIRPVSGDALFSAADFSSEELRVYRAADGKRLLGVSVGSPSPSREGFALAPDGSQLAVLTRDQIAVYSVPVK